MAIICQQHRLLFIQAPRTGCTAIEKLLVDHFGGESLPSEDILDSDGFVRVGRKHCTVKQLLDEKILPTDYATRYTTVTTVRNPFDSLVSLYVKKRESYQERLQDPASWVHRVRGYVEDMEYCRTHTFEEWLFKRYAVSPIDRLLGRRHRSLSGRYTDGVARVLRFERLQADFESVMRHLGIDGDLTIPSINITRQRRNTFQDYYTPDARRLVEYVFGPELDRYGYTFDGLSQQPAAQVEMEAPR